MRIAVLYFDDLSADGDLRYLSEGLTEALIQQLGSVDPLTVVSRNGVKPYRNLDFPVDSLARLLGTGHLVEGSVEQRGDELLARVRLIDGVTGTEHSSREVSASGDDPLALRDLIVAETARFLGQELGRELQLVEARSKTENDEAWSLVREAVHKEHEDKSSNHDGARDGIPSMQEKGISSPLREAEGSRARAREDPGETSRRSPFNVPVFA